MKKKIIGKKGKEKWYPKYAPHIILGTNISLLDLIYEKEYFKRKYDTQIISLFWFNGTYSYT